MDAGRLGDNVGGQGLRVQPEGRPERSTSSATRAARTRTATTPTPAPPSSGPTARPFAAAAADIKAEEIIGIKSSFTGEGALGSAWISQYKSARRLGYLNGVTIGVSDTDKNNRYDTSVSPYFDGETFGVYKAAANLWSGSIA